MPLATATGQNNAVNSNVLTTVLSVEPLPTSCPTLLECSRNESRLAFQIITDAYPQETSLIIERLDT